MLVIPQLMPEFERRLGKPVFVHHLPHAGTPWRRKLAPDTATHRATRRHVPTGKNSQRAGTSRRQLAVTAFAADVPGRGALWPHQRLPLLLGSITHCVQRSRPCSRTNIAHAYAAVSPDGWQCGQPGAASSQWCMHGIVLQRLHVATPKERTSSWCRRRRLAPWCHGPASQSQAALPATAFTGTQPGGAALGAPAREALPHRAFDSLDALEETATRCVNSNHIQTLPKVITFWQ